MRLLDILAHAKDTKSAGLKMRVHGLAVTIEHPRGTVRRLHDDTGKLVYAKTMLAHYGYFDKTKGRDGDVPSTLTGKTIDGVTPTSELFPDLNLSAVAEAIPCNQSHLYNILHGERFGTVRMLQRVAIVLRLPLPDLLAIQAEAARLRAERQDDAEAVAV